MLVWNSTSPITDKQSTPSTSHTTMKESLLSSTSMIVVSNRLPFVLVRDEKTGKLHRKQCAGGLVTAVAPVVVDCGGMWVGWAGMHDLNEPIPEADPTEVGPTSGLTSEQVIAVNMDKELFNSYYNGCCNGTFWPLFHSMPDRAIFKADSWQAYKEINQVFAEKTMEALRRVYEKKGDELLDNPPLVWLHDYHLMVAANFIRRMSEEESLKCKIGFFMHIPFPSWDMMRLFPWDDEILEGLLGCDMVAFHIDDYCFNFIDCCQRRLGCRVDKEHMLVEIAGRTIRIRALPIAIPFDRFVKMAKEAPRMMKPSHEQIILGVDRLDYTKGLVHRVRAFERLLEKHPELIEKVTFLQVAVPSRTDVKEYQDLKEEMDQLIGRVNGRFTTPNWSPIRYIYGCVSQMELAAYYRDSSVALVTPLRDGMNLVAKEYVACQTENPGVLILSPFAGAGEQMHEALLVNPYESDEMADTIYRALTMPKDERELRMQLLRKREKTCDVSYWLRSFLKAMGKLKLESDEDQITQMTPLTLEDFDKDLHNYLQTDCRLALLLDYDGTLAPIAPHPDLAMLPDETRKVLERLCNIRDVHVAIVSGRNLDNVRQMVGIENITYAGNHGLEILHPDGTKFVHPIPHEYEEKLHTLLRSLQEECCRDGAWVENKGVILTFHYRETPHHLRSELVSRATELFQKYGFKPAHAHCAIEAKPPVEWNKGRACIYILRTLYGVNWYDRAKIIYVGDDNTDEDAMKVLQGVACTFRVSDNPTTKTYARHRLSATDAVLTLLKWVEKRMGGTAARIRRTSSPRSGNTPTTRTISSQMSINEGEIEDILRMKRDMSPPEERHPNGVDIPHAKR